MVRVSARGEHGKTAFRRSMTADSQPVGDFISLFRPSQFFSFPVENEANTRGAINDSLCSQTTGYTAHPASLGTI